LVRTLKDDDQLVEAAATNALQKIAPESVREAEP
jgi:hypothetical protein